MTEEEALVEVLTRLDRLNIPYMITGSFASNYYGQPRATADADLVLEIEPRDAARIEAAFHDEFYASRPMIEDAAARRRSFNLIHLGSSFKIDCIVRKDRPFSREEFSRRRKAQLWGRDVWMASPEDVILSKLESSRIGDSELRFQDALKTLRVQRDALDLGYLRRWAIELGVEGLLDGLLVG